MITVFILISGNKNGIENRRAKVRLSVPKFDVSSQTDLIQGLINETKPSNPPPSENDPFTI